jgi:hypothetical protein
MDRRRSRARRRPRACLKLRASVDIRRYRNTSAREPFHVDVNVGDPIWPEPAEIYLPRLLGQEPIQLRGYSMEIVLAEEDRIEAAANAPVS